ncbi:PREDICTED: NAC domain-containing protein 101-like [Nicotiana attenuata]|uniref:Nac domain-containing protein 101 n=1 Tax=Nicotiana attenuata TaxID=49451 RepID=A0A314L3Q5_NICAT|nr:PREDICTED: NAC domain-containing protein 101-like [Nicotiana attenuata]OIT35584.1 nac domain-containing protein 101 [Nicotiana attenuata]
MATENDDLITEFPPGYRFVPTDEELIKYYLENKVHYQPFPALFIEDIHAKEFYNKSPEALVENMCSAGEWYFFIHQDEYFRGKIGKFQIVGNEIGFWQCFGKEFPIYNSEGDVVGFKINFKYCSRSAKKNTWIMEKYRLSFECAIDDEEIEEWVLGRIIRGQKKDYANYY